MQAALFWGQVALVLASGVGTAGWKLPRARPRWVAPSQCFRLARGVVASPDPNVPSDGAARRVLLVQLGSADARG